MNPKLHFIDVASSRRSETFAQVVVAGLSATPKSLPCRYFYDSAGSLLFEQICQLPEYYLTRTEQRILQEQLSEIVRAAGQQVSLIEFGSGSSCKTRYLISGLLERQETLHYAPIDISRDFLHSSALGLLCDYPGLNVTAIAAEYNDAIDVLPSHDGPRLVLVLGSNIGNFVRSEAIAFLTKIRNQMRREDRILIGVDLVKSRSLLEAAYNDSSAVTEAFNKNILVRINEELRGDFRLDQFRHSAPFVPEEARIEMRLISRLPQTVHLPGAGRDFHFDEGEFIHTENSHKYTLADFAELCHAAKLEIHQHWSDPEQWFGLLMLKPCGS